jgi:hypothetical protein
LPRITGGDWQLIVALLTTISYQVFTSQFHLPCGHFTAAATTATAATTRDVKTANSSP